MTDLDSILREIERLRGLHAKATPGDWYIGDINTDPEIGSVGEIAILAKDPKGPRGFRCPAVALPFKGWPIDIAAFNAEVICAAVNALPSLLDGYERTVLALKAAEDLAYSAERVWRKYGHDDNGEPSDWTEWRNVADDAAKFRDALSSLKAQP
jgi:hypothetical protein